MGDVGVVLCVCVRDKEDASVRLECVEFVERESGRRLGNGEFVHAEGEAIFTSHDERKHLRDFGLGERRVFKYGIIWVPNVVAFGVVARFRRSTWAWWVVR